VAVYEDIVAPEIKAELTTKSGGRFKVKMSVERMPPFERGVILRL